jgi:chromosome segregation ATPase
MAEAEWITYAEAAKRLGISVEGVRLKVRRDQQKGRDAKLRVRRDNEGRMLLAWDNTLLDQRSPQRGVQHDGEDIGHISALEAHIQTLAQQLAQQRSDLERMRVERDDAHQATECERQRADALADRLNQVQRERLGEVEARTQLAVELEQARARVGDLKNELERARRPWWRVLIRSEK